MNIHLKKKERQEEHQEKRRKSLLTDAIDLVWKCYPSRGKGWLLHVKQPNGRKRGGQDAMSCSFLKEKRSQGKKMWGDDQRFWATRTNSFSFSLISSLVSYVFLLISSLSIFSSSFPVQTTRGIINESVKRVFKSRIHLTVISRDFSPPVVQTWQQKPSHLDKNPDHLDPIFSFHSRNRDKNVTIRTLNGEEWG